MDLCQLSITAGGVLAKRAGAADEVPSRFRATMPERMEQHANSDNHHRRLPQT